MSEVRRGQILQHDRLVAQQLGGRQRRRPARNDAQGDLGRVERAGQVVRLSLRVHHEDPRSPDHAQDRACPVVLAYGVAARLHAEDISRASGGGQHVPEEQPIATREQFAFIAAKPPTVAEELELRIAAALRIDPA